MFLIDLQIFNCIMCFLGITAISIQNSINEEKAFFVFYICSFFRNKAF
jgi:hypothetical protein